MTDGQRLALEQLREVEALSEGALEILKLSEGDSDSSNVTVELSVRTEGFARAPAGIPLRNRERFVVVVPPDFPFDHPALWTPHTRFAGFAHVQWKRHLCLYQAPSTEWDASDGMFGFLARLDEWLHQAALDQLDPVGAPLHPPVAYTVSDRMIIPRVDTPVVAGEPWLGLAHLRVVSYRRADVVGWSSLFEESPPPASVGAAVLLAEPMPFEFPRTVTDLMTEVESRGVARRLLLLTLQAAVAWNPEESGLFVLIGTPMRGIRGAAERKQHLTAWYISPTIAKGLRLALHKYSAHERLREIGADVEKIIWDWAAEAGVNWCAVREQRPEIVTRRDHDSPLAWFRGRTVALWGCGALGSHVAEFLTRAGARTLILRDEGVVAPGLVVRQLFDDADIGEPKVEALEHRLRRIREDVAIETHTSDLLTEPLGGGELAEDADVIIETTGSRAVLKKTELRWGDSRRRPTIASFVVGPRAERAVMVLAHAEHSGGPADVARRAKLAACGDPRLLRFLDEFWPDGERDGRRMFQPEPGCSDPTFVGSAADAAVLAGAMLNRLALGLAARSSSATACFIGQPHLHAGSNEEEAAFAEFHWATERTDRDCRSGYDVRISAEAWQAMLACIDRSRRRRGWRVETGGLLFGERDDAARVIWITDASDPPPDSRATRYGFICGVEGTAEMNAEKRSRTRGSVQFVGTWHTHPGSPPLPSDVDLSGMAQIVTSMDPPIGKALLLILGHTPKTPTPAAYLFGRRDFVIVSRLEPPMRRRPWTWLTDRLRLWAGSGRIGKQQEDHEPIA